MAGVSACFDDHTDLKRMKKQREVMWERYHKMRSSQSFRDGWFAFLKTVGCVAVPAFYQFVTDSLMEQLIKLNYPVMEVQVATDDDISLDKEERNTVRYTAGYMVRSLLKKVKRSKLKQKDELRKCLEEMVESEEESNTHDSTKWTKAIDRVRNNKARELVM